MRKKYVVNRSGNYYFVCRVPNDLKHHFPRSIIWKALHCTEKKDAHVIASTYEYRTQKLFMQLRSCMLTSDLEKSLVASFLLHGVARIQAQATGTPLSPPIISSNPVDYIFKAEAGMQQNGRALALKALGQSSSAAVFKDVLLGDIAQLRQYLVNKESDGCPFDLDYVANELKKTLGLKLTEPERRALGLRLIDAQIQLHEAESASLDGHWSHMNTLQNTAENALKSPYIPIAEAINKYQRHYIASKPDVKRGTVADMEIECRTLQEIAGNISIEAFNKMDTVTKFKSVLRKYPLNRQQRYPKKSLSAILKTSNYDVIQPKTANEYIKRAKSIVDYALKDKMLNATNVWIGELFNTVVAAEDQRSAYDKSDIERLIEAICTKPLWRYAPAKPERFWIILIALFQGFRLTNIIELTKADICQTDSDTWVFRVRTGKRKSTVKSYAINDCLLLLGFLEWVNGLKRNTLFQDSSDSFSKFYNRSETRKSGYVVGGFEAKYVTTDPKKCLYSLRHSFAAKVYGASTDYKLTADMMGQSTGASVTARYMKAVGVEKLKAVSDKLAFEGIDLDKLEARAIELFGIVS